MKINELDIETILTENLLELVEPECRCGVSINAGGWIRLINKTLQKMLLVAKTFNIDIVFDQIKEKFGGLRIYYHTQENISVQLDKKILNIVADILFDIVNKDEEDSFKTCYYTGEYGSLHSRGGWIITLSDEKAKELGAVKIEMPKLTQIRIKK